MGARVCIGARWWGGSYRHRPPYAWPEPESITFVPVGPELAIAAMEGLMACAQEIADRLFDHPPKGWSIPE